MSDELSGRAGKTAEIQGWLYKKRAMGALMFIIIRDRRGLAQVVIQDEVEQAKLHGMQHGTILKATGQIKADERAMGGAEMHDPVIEVMVPVEDTPPIEIDKPIDHKPDNLDTLFEHRALNLRNTTEQGIFRVQAQIVRAVRDFFDTRDFVDIHTPKLLAAATEGGAEVFKLDYFGRTATLAQSPQFYKQMMVGVYERVYEIAPVYRAEPSLTTRHLSEYVSIDAEMGFIQDFSEVEALLEQLLAYVVEQVWQECEQDLMALGAAKPVLAKSIPRLPMTQIHQLYSKATGEETTKEKDLSPAEERWICDYAEKEHGSQAVFVTDWPASSMKFYHYQNPADAELAVRTDLLFRGVEIVTGSQREHRHDQLVAQLRAAGGDPAVEGFKYYLQAFQYGLPPHGGFGLGLERLTQKIIGLNNVKEAALFPRDMQRLSP